MLRRLPVLQCPLLANIGTEFPSLHLPVLATSGSKGLVSMYSFLRSRDGPHQLFQVAKLIKSDQGDCTDRGSRSRDSEFNVTPQVVGVETALSGA